jgi:hypothetical protein
VVAEGGKFNVSFPLIAFGVFLDKHKGRTPIEQSARALVLPVCLRC